MAGTRILIQSPIFGPNSGIMDDIKIIGAAEHNLKNIDLQIPKGKFTVITGVSGSGKSSLVRDVLQREGQRMYLETFSAYTRSKLGKVRPSHVKDVNGLLPVLSVGQTHVQANRRSTAGTFSELLPFLRQLFARYNDQNLALTRSQFSFNTEQGWCPKCKGLGIEEFIDADKLIDDSTKTLRDGALKITLPNGYTIYSQVTIDELNKVCNAHGFDVDTPWSELSAGQQYVVLNGSQKVKVLYGKHSLQSRMKWSGMTAKPRDEGFYKGILPVMEEILRRDRNDNILKFVSARKCPACGGARLNETARQVSWHNESLFEYESRPFAELFRVIKQIRCNSQGEQDLVKLLADRLEQLIALSLGHISPDRLSETLSQGELRRMRLAQLNYNGLTGVLYLFDEPSIGLHPRDVHRIIENIYSLLAHGNTVVVVEHSEAIIRAAQHLIELGPGAGKYGGRVVFSGSPEALIQKKIKDSPTAKSLIKTHQISVNAHKGGTVSTFEINIERANNIVRQKFVFARNGMNVITGVSGAGKSTLVYHGLLKSRHFKNVIFVDQKPIGRTSRSNPATYTGLFDELRKLFAATDTANAAGLKAKDFSFNNKEGQCKACLGSGSYVTGMHIFEDLVQPCPVCKGARYNDHILKVKYKGSNIHEILRMDVQEAHAFFNTETRIKRFLRMLIDLGLGYLQLGQPSTTLSGGEAQRIKLAKYLQSPVKSEQLYVLDEPTTGLHASDIDRLMKILKQFLLNGHTLVVVEHDVQVIQQADWVVDMGPEGGEEGGKSLFSGPAKTFLSGNNSPTQQFLKNTKRTFTKPAQTSEIPIIDIKNVTTNNLKNIDLKVPFNQILAVTGPSGSGKTSLIIDTLLSEGQRIFTENLAGFRRLQMKFGASANIGKVNSMTPTVAVNNELHKPDIKATVASVSGLYDLLRLLFARFAKHPDGAQASAADFSTSNEFSVCSVCEGSGFRKVCKPEDIITNPDKPLLNGALHDHKTVTYFSSTQNKFRWILEAMASSASIDLARPWNVFSKQEKQKILFGTVDTQYYVKWPFERKNNKGVYEFTDRWVGLCHMIEAEYRNHFPSKRGKLAMELLTDEPCAQCGGYRLNDSMLRFTFDGLHMGQIMELTLNELLNRIENPVFKEISGPLLNQIKEKTHFMVDSGLGKLPLGRPAAMLSGGEHKWIRLSSLLSSSLSGMCIILDEPSYGLDNNGRNHLIKAFKLAKVRGNTIVFSDHHPEMLKVADRVIEIGPGSGSSGGEVVFDTSTGQNLQRIIDEKIVVSGRKIRALKSKNKLQKIQGLEQPFYYNALNCIAGPMGSGKTKLIQHLYKVLSGMRNSIVVYSGDFNSSANGRSSIATRTNILNDLKKVFSTTKAAKQAGLKAADFGYNSKKFQCPACKGAGIIKTSLDFLPDVEERCPECEGRRYNPEILNFTAKGKHIAQWLSLTLSELDKEDIWSARSRAFIDLAKSINLDYLSPDRDYNKLSGGEQQRIGIIEKFVSIGNEHAVILFDSASEGLDLGNVMNLISFFDALIHKGHTIIAADSNPLLSENADHIVRL